MKKQTIFILTVLIALMWNVNSSLAQEKYVFDKNESSIKGAVKYTLVGKYRANFNEYEGAIYFDPDNISKSSVYLKIKANSIKSKFSALDRIVKSKRILNTKKYPDVIFQSEKIERVENGYSVTGSLSLHGVTKKFTFPFKLEGPLNDDGGVYLSAQGKWLIDRKQFNVTWSKLLDKGGVVVGNNITVDWKVKAYK